MNSNDPMAWLRQLQAGQPWLQMPASGWPASSAMPWAALQPSFASAFPGALPGFAAGSPGFQNAAGDSAGSAGASADIMARLLAQGRRYLELLQGLTVPGLLGEDGQFDAGKWLQGLKQMHHSHGPGLAGVSSLPWLGAGDGNVMEAMVRSLVNGLASGVRNEADAWLTLPTFGPAREHHERIQGLLRAWLDYQAANARHGELMHGSATRTLEVLEDRLAQRDADSQPLATPRAVFDLLIDAAEEAFAELAMSAEFAQLSGELTNAQMRVRAAVNAQIEQMAAQLGLPTRTEVDSLGRKVQALTRQLRRRDAGQGRDAVSTTAADQSAATDTGRAAGQAKKAVRPAAGRTPTRSAASPAAKSAPPARKTAARKSVSKTATKSARKAVSKSPTKTASKAVSKTATKTAARTTATKAATKTASKAASKTASRTRTKARSRPSATAGKSAASRSRSSSSGKAASQRGSARASTRKAPGPVLRSTKTKG